MRGVLKNVAPDSLDDLAICNALYRPGSTAFIRQLIENKRNPNIISYTTPLLEPILKETYGMFGLLDLSKEQIKRLQTEFSIYIPGNGRINFAGLVMSQIEYVGEGIATDL